LFLPGKTARDQPWTLPPASRSPARGRSPFPRRCASSPSPGHGLPTGGFGLLSSSRPPVPVDFDPARPCFCQRPWRWSLERQLTGASFTGYVAEGLPTGD